MDVDDLHRSARGDGCLSISLSRVRPLERGAFDCDVWIYLAGPVPSLVGSVQAERPRTWRSNIRSLLRIALDATIATKYTKAAQTTPKTSERGLLNVKGIRTRIMIPEAPSAEIRNFQPIFRRRVRRDSHKEMQS